MPYYVLQKPHLHQNCMHPLGHKSSQIELELKNIQFFFLILALFACRVCVCAGQQFSCVAYSKL